MNSNQLGALIFLAAFILAGLAEVKLWHKK
jgi:hypothetical protein